MQPFHMPSKSASMDVSPPIHPSQNHRIKSLTFDQLQAIGLGHVQFQLLWAGTELDLFSLLSKHSSLTLIQIAVHLNLKKQPTRILLEGLLALAIIEKDGMHFRNSKIAEQRLVRGTPECVIPILAWQHHIVYQGLTDFTDSLRLNRNVGLQHFKGCGDTLYERLQSDQKTERIFQEAMSCLSGQANALLVSKLDGTKISHIVDLGGGDGTNAINLVRRFPKLQATVFDSNTVICQAQQKIQDADLTHRVSTHSGDFFQDSIPTYADAFLLAHICPIWSAQRNIELMQRCWDALPLGGRLFIFNMSTQADGTGQTTNALGSPYFHTIATGEGMMYQRADYEQWLLTAGFKNIEIQRLPFHHILITAIKTQATKLRTNLRGQ